MEIVFGEGGKDSKLFVDDLMTAYIKYAYSLKLQSEILTTDEGHAVLQFKGKGAGSAFKHESGKHCIQRIPPTEGKGRKQTSMVCVAILPMPPDNKYKPLPEGDLETKTQCGHGPGGQHQNKTASAVRLTHKPTGIQVFINGRDQHANKREALRILTARVNEKAVSERSAEYSDLRKRQIDGGGRGNKIRTYNWLESRVVDHRLGVKTKAIREVLEKGRFGILFEGDKE